MNSIGNAKDFRPILQALNYRDDNPSSRKRGPSKRGGEYSHVSDLACWNSRLIAGRYAVVRHPSTPAPLNAKSAGKPEAGPSNMRYAAEEMPYSLRWNSPTWIPSLIG
jgi:hypothetical protein